MGDNEKNGGYAPPPLELEKGDSVPLGSLLQFEKEDEQGGDAPLQIRERGDSEILREE